MLCHGTGVLVERCTASLEERDRTRRNGQGHSQFRTNDELSRFHSLLLHRVLLRLSLRVRTPGIPESDTLRNSDRAPHHTPGKTLLLPPLLKSTEMHLLLRVHQMDCLHRQSGETVCAPDRAPQSSWVADVHAFPSTSTSSSSASSHQMAGFGAESGRGAGGAGRGKNRVLDDAAAHFHNRAPGRRRSTAAASLRQGTDAFDRSTCDRADAWDERDGFLEEATKKTSDAGIAPVVITLVIAHVVLLFTALELQLLLDPS